MKRSIAYIAMAVVLGTALMLTPIGLFLAATQYQAAPTNQYLGFLPETLERAQALPAKTEDLAGVRVNQPADTISVSLMLTFSLAFALGASLYLKKRVHNSLFV